MAKVGLHGFLCNSNIGDQAMAVAIVSALRKAGHSVQVFAFGNSMDDAAQLAQLGARVTPDRYRYAVRELDALVVGGGELGPGFGAQLQATAAVAGVKVLHFGQSYSDEWLRNTYVSKQLLSWCSFVRPRDAYSCKVLEQLGVPGLHPCGDPAFALQFTVQAQEPYALLFVRHTKPGASPAQLMHVKQALRCIAAMQLEPRVAFCDSADEEYWQQLNSVLTGYKLKQYMLRSPQQALELVSRSSGIVTLGRYHPAVFAAMTGRPCVGVGDKLQHSKLCGIADLNTLPYTVAQTYAGGDLWRQTIAIALEELCNAVERR